jgi:hypothetical protein
MMAVAAVDGVPSQENARTRYLSRGWEGQGLTHCGRRSRGYLGLWTYSPLRTQLFARRRRT